MIRKFVSREFIFPFIVYDAGKFILDDIFPHFLLVQGTCGCGVIAGGARMKVIRQIYDKKTGQRNSGWPEMQKVIEPNLCTADSEM